MGWYEREEQAAFDDYRAGHITEKELNDQLRELQRDYREAAEEAAEQAYRNELENW